MASKDKLPLTIYVYKEDDDDDGFFMAYDNERDCASLEEVRLVGRYELKETFSLSAEAVIKKGK